MTYLTKQKMQIKQLTDQSSQLNTTVILSKCIAQWPTTQACGSPMGSPMAPTYAMGSPMAPTYANIFMAILERKLLNEAPQGLIPIEWIKFIDDIFAIWTHGIEKLQKFLSYINNFHPTIKFDNTYSYKSVNFLDTTVYINRNNKLESDLRRISSPRTKLLAARCECMHEHFHPITMLNS